MHIKIPAGKLLPVFIACSFVILCLMAPAGAISLSGAPLPTPNPTSMHLVFIPTAAETTVNERGMLVMPQTGSLSIDSSPNGASVTLDGTVVGTTPYSADDLAPGTHTVLLTLTGYYDYDDTITVTTDQELQQSYELTPVAKENKKKAPVVKHKARVRKITPTPVTTTKVPSAGQHPSNMERIANPPPTTTEKASAHAIHGALLQEPNICHLDAATGKCTGICPGTGRSCEATKNPACEGTQMSEFTQCGCVDSSSKLSLLASGKATVKLPAGSKSPGTKMQKATPGLLESILSPVTSFFRKNVLGRPEIKSEEVKNYLMIDPSLTTDLLCREFSSPTILTYAGDTTGGIDISTGDPMVGTFAWDSADPRVRSVVWQLSILPFPADQGSSATWSEVPGLLAQGNLVADKHTFSIDFSKSVPTGTEVLNAWSEKPAYLNVKKGALISLRNGIQSAEHTASAQPKAGSAVRQAEMTRLNSAIETINTKLTRPAAFTFQPMTRTSVLQHINTAALPGGAEYNAAQQAAKHELSSGVLAPGLGTPSVTKEGLAHTLPMAQRIYFIRVLPFDWQGNYTGNPSNTKLMVIGEPLYNVTGPGLFRQDPAEPLLLESDRLDERGHSIGDTDRVYVTYKLTKGNLLTPGYISENVTWDRTKPVGFAWNTSRPDIVSAVWQVSATPFDQDNPVFNDPGIVAQGTLDINETDPDLFVRGIDQCINRIGEVVDFNPANKNPCTSLPLGVDKVHIFGINFSAFATKPDNNNPGMTRYYVRVVTSEPTSIPLQYITHVSQQTEVDWVPANHIEIFMCTMPKYIDYTYEVPDIAIINYTPIQPRSPDYNCWGVVTTGYEYWVNYYSAAPGIPHGSKGEMGTVENFADAQSNGHHDGDVINLCQPPQEDTHWYTAIVDFFDGLVNFFEQILGSLASAFNTIKSAVVTAACFGSTDPTCQTIMGAVLDMVLAAEGIPPTIPNFDQLMHEGAEYLAATVADETGVPASAAKQIADIAVESFSHVPNPNDSMGIQPYPPKQYQPAKITIQLTNHDPVNATPPGTLMVTDNGALQYTTQFINIYTEKDYVPLYSTLEPVIPFPSVPAGKTITFPVVLYENQWQGTSCDICGGIYGTSCVPEPCEDAYPGFTSQQWGDAWMDMVNRDLPDPFYLTTNGIGQNLIDNITESMSAKYGVQFTNSSYYMFDFKNPDCKTQTYKLNFKRVNTYNLKEWEPSPTFVVDNVGTAKGPVPYP